VQALAQIDAITATINRRAAALPDALVVAGGTLAAGD
jgi:hypothetical protein